MQSLTPEEIDSALDSLTEKESRALLRIMSQIIVVRCEAVYYTGTLEYVALSPHFEKLAEGEMLLDYEVRINNESVEFV